MPRTLTQPEIDSFRAKICEVAARLFAERGFEGVTLRTITDQAGCSAMTPYRYFTGKEEILAAIRAEAFRRFAEKLEAARDKESDPLDQIRAMCSAQFDFAESEPHSYKLMFEYLQIGEFPELEEQGKRARKILYEIFKRAAATGAIEGEYRALAHIGWSMIHGAITLELQGQLQFGPSLRSIRSQLVETMIRGMQPRKKTEKNRRT